MSNVNVMLSPVLARERGLDRCVWGRGGRVLGTCEFVAEEERKVENQIQIQIQCKQIQILGTSEACCRGGQGGEAGLLLLDLLVDGDSKDLTTSGFTYLQFFRWNKTQLCYISKLSLSMSMRHPPKSLTLTRKFNSPKKRFD